MRRLSGLIAGALSAVLVLLTSSSLVTATVTPQAQPNPMIGGHSNEDSGGQDPATWTSSSVDTGTTTGFSLWGNIAAATNGVSVYSWKTVEDGAKYEDTISAAQDPKFKFEVDLKVKIKAWVSPHAPDNDTDYWCFARGRVKLRLWKDGEADPFLDTANLYLKEVQRVPEQASPHEDESTALFQGEYPTDDFKLEYLAMGTVWVQSSRIGPENIVRASSATDHGPAGTQIGFVQKKDGNNNVGNPTSLE